MVRAVSGPARVGLEVGAVGVVVVTAVADVAMEEGVSAGFVQSEAGVGVVQYEPEIADLRADLAEMHAVAENNTLQYLYKMERTRLV